MNLITYLERLLAVGVFISVFIIPNSVFAFAYSSEPCGAIKDDCPAGPIAGLTLNKTRDDVHLYNDEGSKNVECTYGGGSAGEDKIISIKYFCMTDEATAKLESEYSSYTKERPQEPVSEGRVKLSTRKRGPCDIPSPGNVDAQRCSGYTHAGKYFVYVISTYPWNADGIGKDEREANIVASEAGAMKYVDAGIAAAKNFHPKERAKNAIKGRAYSLDVLNLEEPIPYAKLSLKLGNKTYRTVANENGEYEFDIDEGNTVKKGILTLLLMAEKDGKEYFEVVDDSVNKETVEISSEVNIEDGIDIVIGLALGNEYKSTSDFRKVRGLTSKYHELYKAIDYAESVLKLDITSLKGESVLPISVYAYSADTVESGSSHYDPAYGTIHLTTEDSAYISDGPFTVFHEFGHHIMHTFYSPVVWNESLEVAGNETHAGILNTNTADSLGEGYATFFALLAAQGQGYTYPHVYSPSPVVFDRNWEVNIQAWDMEGSLSREEFAVVSLLNDLVDKHKDKGDNIEMSVNNLLEVIKNDEVQTVKTLYDKLITVEDKDKIDALFIAHGFFWDKQEGDGYWNTGGTYTNPDTWATCTTTAWEPVQDTDNNGAIDTDVDKWMDYSNWNQYPCIPVFDEGDVVGFTGSYQTSSRESFVNLPNRYMEVNNGTYVQSFTFPDNPEYDYVLTHEVTNNMMPVIFPPSRYNATLNVKDSEELSIVISTNDYNTAIADTSEENIFKSIRTKKDSGLPIGWIVVAFLAMTGLWLRKKIVSK